MASTSLNFEDVGDRFFPLFCCEAFEAAGIASFSIIYLCYPSFESVSRLPNRIAIAKKRCFQFCTCCLPLFFSC